MSTCEFHHIDDQIVGVNRMAFHICFLTQGETLEPNAVEVPSKASAQVGKHNSSAVWLYGYPLKRVIDWGCHQR